MRRLAPVLLILLALAGCAKRTVIHTVTVHAAAPVCIPPVGVGGTTGDPCRATLRLGAGRPTTSRGCQIPDVSYFQGHPNWAAAKRDGVCGGIARVADGNFTDPAFGYNWSELRRLHIWHAVYFFVRPGNCAAEADRAIALVNSQGGFDSGPLIADDEVPLNQGCAAAFTGEAERRLHRVSVDYTASGTWSGGPHGDAPLWDAAYGPSPGCVWTCAIVAWQHTDGQIGAYPHCLPGFGCGDLSTDYGLTRLGGHPTPPCDRACQRRRLTKLVGYRHYIRRILVTHGCRVQHPRMACVKLLRRGAQVNREIRSLGGH